MKSVKPLYLLMILALVVFILTLNQGFAVGDSIYPLPPPSSQASMVDYPEKVKESLKNTVGITVNISLKNYVHPLLRRELKSTGSGFMLEPGIIVSARHILMAGIDNLISVGYPSPFFDRHGVPSSDIFDYSVFGTTDVGNQARNLKLSLIGMGALDKFEDYMIFRVSNYPPELKSIEAEPKILKIGEVVYNAGYVHSLLYINRIANEPILFDIIRKSFAGSIDEVITGLSINQAGVSAIYRIEIKMESGFSGGPILNSQGKAIGITVMRNDNYLYAIPIQDIKLFSEKIKKDGVIK